jgi:hypothetical protein
VSTIAATINPRANAIYARALLDNAIALHQQIANTGLKLRDDTNVYQQNWRDAIVAVLNEKQDDYDYLDLL